MWVQYDIIGGTVVGQVNLTSWQLGWIVRALLESSPCERLCFCISISTEAYIIDYSKFATEHLMHIQNLIKDSESLLVLELRTSYVKTLL